MADEDKRKRLLRRKLELRKRKLETKRARLEQSGKKISKSEAFISGALQGATLGFAEEIGAAIETAPSVGGILGFTRAEEPILGGERVERPSFEAALQRRQRELKQQRVEQPGSFFVGELAGSLAGLAIPGLGLARGGATAAQLVGTGTIVGGFAGAGRARPGERLEAAAIGAGAGAVTGVFGIAAGRTLELSSDLIKKAVAGRFGSNAQGGALRGILDFTRDSLKSGSERATSFSKAIKKEEEVRKEALKIAEAALSVNERLQGKTVVQKLAEIQGEQTPSGIGALGRAAGALISPEGFLTRQSLQGQEQLRAAGRLVLPAIAAEQQALAPNLFRRAR